MSHQAPQDPRPATDAQPSPPIPRTEPGQTWQPGSVQPDGAYPPPARTNKKLWIGLGSVAAVLVVIFAGAVVLLTVHGHSGRSKPKAAATDSDKTKSFTIKMEVSGKVSPVDIQYGVLGDGLKHSRRQSVPWTKTMTVKATDLSMFSVGAVPSHPYPPPDGGLMCKITVNGRAYPSNRGPDRCTASASVDNPAGG